MIRATKRAYNRLFAEFILLTAETFTAIFLFIILFAVSQTAARYIFIDSKQAFDTAFFNHLSRYNTPANTGLMLFLTGFGNYQFLVIANLLLAGWFLFVRRHPWYSIRMGAIALGSTLLMLILKHGFNQKRPPVSLLDPVVGLNFLSGHAASSITFYGLLIYFICRKKDSNIYLRIFLISFFIALMLTIGLSRIFFRVYYASDVIGGFCTGIIWLLISIWVLEKLECYSKTKLHDRVDHSEIS